MADRSQFSCSECSETNIVCTRCLHDPVVVRTTYPLTDVARRLTHIGVCDLHGAITQRCRCSTHLLDPVDVRPVAETESADREFRAGSICLLIGFVLGVCVTLLLLPLIMAKLQ